VNIYDDMRAALSAELALASSQGSIVYHYSTYDNSTPWDPVETPADPVPVSGVVSGVSERYVDGSTVVATDLQCLLEVLPGGIEPTTAGTLEVDGSTYQIVRVDAIPSAGEPVAWRVFIRA